MAKKKSWIKQCHIGKMGGQSFTMSQKYIKSRFRVWGIWPSNLVAMVGKITVTQTFIATKDEDHENAYPFLM